jgi:hypothetical protein
MRTLITTVLLIFVTITAGCGNNVRVTGKVTFEDGSPVTAGTVIFTTEKAQFSGFIKNGSYDAGATKNGQGIPPGTYKVWLSDTARVEAIPNSPDTAAFPQITAEFTSPSGTPLQLEVKSGGSITFDISVKRHPDWDKTLEKVK